MIQKNFLNLKQAKFYLKGMNKLTDKWQQDVTENKSEYTINGN